VILVRSSDCNCKTCTRSEVLFAAAEAAKSRAYNIIVIDIMRELEGGKIIIYVVALASVAALAPILDRFPRTRGTNLFYQGAFLIGAMLTIALVPDYVQDEIFSPGGVVVVGTVLPVYSSICAVCTIGDEDDSVWLQYWIANGAFSYLTEFVDDIRNAFPAGGEHWYEFEFFVTLWLFLPFTDGAALIYDAFTEPYISPTAKRLNDKVQGWIGFILTAVNASYLSFAWWIFMMFPEPARRFFVIAIGTIYPLAASTVALTTKETGGDDTFWLTYWCCFGVLFLAMDYLENFVGQIPGFYSLCMAATMYLFLPMFDGANVIFRRVLVPLSGQYENMLLRDAYLVRKDMEKNIPVAYHEKIFRKAADVFVPGSKEKST
jgi:receptor expression-enhancing protein 5/6